MTARRPRLWAFFELFALVGFVIAQPTLDVLGKAPDLFLFRQAGRAEILALVLAGVTDQMVRADSGYPGWFQFGPHGDLVGRRAGEVGVDPASAGSARVEKLAGHRRVDPGRGLVPAQVSGPVSLAAGAPDRPVVAVAVNGVIAGVSETFRERRDAKGSQPVGPPDKFSALTLDTVYRKGENRLELFVIDDSGGRVRLRPLAVS
jgi:hypothetical protein